jgi:trimethylamine--corrinoid protein Co-methyltransferase
VAQGASLRPIARPEPATRANARWKASLADYEAPALDEAVDESIRDFVARKKAEMPDQWY